MENVVSLVDIRNERVRDRLLSHARAGETVIVETRSGVISAEKILCRGSFAEILNSFGDYFIVEYADIRQMRPVSAAQTSVVNAAGQWSVPQESAPARSGPGRILRFPGGPRRPSRA